MDSQRKRMKLYIQIDFPRVGTKKILNIQFYPHSCIASSRSQIRSNLINKAEEDLSSFIPFTPYLKVLFWKGGHLCRPKQARGQRELQTLFQMDRSIPKVIKLKEI